MTLYFAYGSNMDRTQMQERCPESRLKGVGYLDNHDIAFTIFSPEKWKGGCADVLPRDGQRVYGLVYEVSVTDVESLDRHEAVHAAKYERVTKEVTYQGSTHNMLTYQVVHKEAGLHPSTAYLNCLITAARQHDFPMSYQKHLASFAKAK